jgi:HPt (histidine-containing phosphotransfer) domain-containing protein
MSENLNNFIKSIGKIEGISIQDGLNRVSGQKDIYKEALRLLLKEIGKCDKNLKGFLSSGDMRNFCIEAHNMKGSLASVGAMELSSRAKELELASSREDSGFFVFILSVFLSEIASLGTLISKTFEANDKNMGVIGNIPPELPEIFNKMTEAFSKTDFLAIESALRNLNKLNLEGTLKEKVAMIEDSVLIMDYESALEMINSIN